MARPIFRPRQAARRPSVSTLALAQRVASKFTAAEMEQIRARVLAQFDALRTGRGTRVHFAGASTCCKLGQAIESQGVVRGLAEQFDQAERVLLLLKAEAERDGGWIIPIPTPEQIEILDEMASLHLFQLEQLSYGEYQAAWQLMMGRVTSCGGEVMRKTHFQLT